MSGLATSFLSSLDTMAPVIVMVLLLIFAVIYCLRRVRKPRGTDLIGFNGERRVARALDRFARKHHCYTLHDVYLPLYDKTTQVDHLLIGRFGVLVVETKATNGDVYGNEEDRQWTHMIGTKKHELYNPLLQNKAHIDCINHLFKKHHIYNVSVEPLVVFAGNDITLNLSKGMPVVHFADLSKGLRRCKKDRRVDAKAIYDFFREVQVTDRKRIKEHTDNVKIMASKQR